MNHKHSFLARCLAMVLALVLVLSNANIGLTMRLQAAENNSLFDLIAQSEDCGNEKMNVVLKYADALYNLNDKTVTYESAPTEAVGALLRHGKLTVSAINGWVPYTYTVNGVKSAFNGATAVELGEAEQAEVVYKLDLNQDEYIADAMTLIAKLAGEAKAQADALNAISGTTAMTALRMLNADFIDSMIEAVDALTFADLGVDANEDLNEDGVVNFIDEMLAEKALEVVKEQYKEIISALNDRLVVAGDYYHDNYLKANGKGTYAGLLTVFAMLKEYQNDGLAHFYLNAQMIVDELEALAVTLYDILGEANEDGTYANDNVVNALIAEMGFDAVDAAGLATMAGRMETAAVKLNELVTYKTEINPKSADLVALTAALVDCGADTTYNADLCLYSKALPVLDDTFKYVKVEITEAGETANYKVDTDTVLTEAIVADIVKAVEAKAPYYNIDTTSIVGLVGTKMSKNVQLAVKAEPKEYTVNIVDAEGTVVDTVKVLGNQKKIELVVPVGHETVYTVDGVVVAEVTSANFEEATPVSFAVDMAKVNAGTFVIVVEDNNCAETKMLELVTKLNQSIGAGAFELEGENGEYTKMTAKITLGDLAAFATIVTENVYGTVKLGGQKLITTEGGILVNAQALIDAILTDPEFSSQRLIALGQNGEGTLLTNTIEFPGYEMAFELYLTSVPSQMETVSAGLKAVEEYFWFESSAVTAAKTRTVADKTLNIYLNLPEKAYEAYLAAAMVTWQLDNDNAAALNNAVAMQFVEDSIKSLLYSDVNFGTVENTLNYVGIEKDLSTLEGYYQLLRKLAVEDQGFVCDVTEQNVYASVTADKQYIADLLALMGLGGSNVTMAMGMLNDEPLSIAGNVVLLNPVPDYEAVVIEPGRVNDAGVKAKLDTFDVTDDLVAKAPTMGSAAIMLLADIEGDLEFPGHMIIDLNGKTVNGNLKVGGKLIVVDSAMDTFNGGKVNGKVEADGGCIMGGTYDDDVSEFLRDGYMQDKGSVRNGMFHTVIENGAITYVLNADFYRTYNGYLPAVEALAVEIAADIAINGYYVYTAVSVDYKGEPVFGPNFDELLASYVGGYYEEGLTGPMDALISDVLGYFGPGIEDLANDILEDLLDIQTLSAALNNGDAICTYPLTFHPLGCEVLHNKDLDILDLTISGAKYASKDATFAVKIVGNNSVFELAKNVLGDMADVLYMGAKVDLKQPTFDVKANDLYIAGGADAFVRIDLTKDEKHTKALAVILAYGNPEHRDALMGAKNCVAELNTIISQMTIEDVFSALKAMSVKVSMADMADAVGYKYSVAEIADMEKVYFAILNGLGEALELLHIDGNNTPLSAYEKSTATYEYSRSGAADVHVDVRSYDGVFEITTSSLTVTIKLAPECNGLIGDVNMDGEIDARDASWMLKHDVLKPVDGKPAATYMHMCVADVNGDGVCDARDASWVLKYDVGKCQYEDFPAVNP